MGDVLVLREYDGKQYTGRVVYKTVTYVLRDAEHFGLMPGYCVIGMTDLTKERKHISNQEYER